MFSSFKFISFILISQKNIFFNYHFTKNMLPFIQSKSASGYISFYILSYSISLFHTKYHLEYIIISKFSGGTMKKKILLFILSALLVIPSISGCKKDSDGLTKITLNEVAHSIFYAPQYVAIELGYFEDEGIDLTVETGFGADKTMTALLSGNADIGFMGSESSIYAYSQGADDYAINFAQLTQRAGNFLVSRNKIPDFQWSDLKGKLVLGGRKGGFHRTM